MQDIFLELESTGLLNEVLNITIDQLLNPLFDGKSGNKELKLNKSSKLNKIFEPSTIETVVKKLTSIYKNFCLNYINEEQLMNEFSQLSIESQKTICSAIKSNRSKILEAQVAAVADPNEKTMRSFDWDVSMVMSSSSLEGKKKLLMNLAITDQNNETSHYELSSSNLGKLIKFLEEK